MHALYGMAQCSQYGYMYLLYNGISWDTFNQVFIIGEPGDNLLASKRPLDHEK